MIGFKIPMKNEKTELISCFPCSLQKGVFAFNRKFKKGE